MKINKIVVNGLFGVFNHIIPLNLESGITIIIGENGLGKTVILESVRAFFSKNFNFFINVEFKSITFYFDTDFAWEVDRIIDTQGSMSLTVTRINTLKDERTKPFKVFETELDGRKSRSDEMRARRRLMHERDFFYHYQMDRDVVSLREYENMMRQRDFYENEYASTNSHRHGTQKKTPQWLDEGFDKVSIKIIETQRIITVKERGGDSYINTVKKFSDDLVQRISSVEKESTSISTELDASYPNRLMQKLRQGETDTPDVLNLALSQLDERRRLLSSVGLIEDLPNADLLKMDVEDLVLMNPLKLYIDDSHKKLAPFDDISKKIDLYKGIINLRFKHKNLEINRKNGFLFRSRSKKDENGFWEKIPSSALSSGEQNELIMFYELIFNTKVGDMIFIDEPELSLHISWQNKFINDLKEVTSMNSVAVVIATHSPDIIDQNWDLRVELEGLE
jgi:predicted ATP-binding protein involved in virulence